MRLMRAADPQRKEDGFQLPRDHVTEHTDELIAEFERDENDHGLRCWQHNCTAPTKPSATGQSPVWRTSAPNRHAEPSARRTQTATSPEHSDDS
jgi:hypothetical protein